MKKKLLVLFMSIAMVLCFAACGGGSGSEEGSEETAAPAADPNTGLRDIVFNVPDGWTVSASEVGNYISYANPDSEFLFSASIFDEEDLSMMQGQEDVKTVQEFYEKHYTAEEDHSDQGYTNEISSLTICDADATYVKAINENKDVFEASTYWMMDNAIYTLSLYYPVDYDENGNPSLTAAEIPALSSDDLATFEAIQASVQPGDGNSLQPAGLEVDSFEGYSFDTPEGYAVGYTDDQSVNMENKDKGISLTFRKVDDAVFESFEWEGEGLPTTLEEYFESGKIGSESVEIAGNEGYLSKYPAEDGNLYDVNAGFMADGVVYEIGMYADAYDENGIKDDAVPLSDEDLAAFNSFLSSISK